MKKLGLVLFLGIVLNGCTKEPITFTYKTYEKKTTLPCQDGCTTTKVTIPIAHHSEIIADSINNKVFSVVKEIVYFGEKAYPSKDYNGLLTSFINSYEELSKDFPEYDMPWEATIEGKIIHQTENLINIEMNHYSFTGGAHGYGGLRSILIDAKTGKSITNAHLFYDVKGFEQLAEQKFRKRFEIPSKDPINSTGLWFKNEKFHLPDNIFYNKKGLLLYYNQYEIASYAEGPIALLLPYQEVEGWLKLK